MKAGHVYVNLDIIVNLIFLFFLADRQLLLRTGNFTRLPVRRTGNKKLIIRPLSRLEFGHDLGQNLRHGARYKLKNALCWRTGAVTAPLNHHDDHKIFIPQSSSVELYKNNVSNKKETTKTAKHLK